MSREKLVPVVYNDNYAGTNKLVTHATDKEYTETLCGMSVHELMMRRGLDWQADESENFSCAKCNRKIVPAPALPPETEPQNETK